MPHAPKNQPATPRSHSLLRRWFSRSASPLRHASRYRPSIDVLEERTLLAASITGSVWHDLNQDGVRVAEPGLAGVTVFIDDGAGAFTGSQQHVETNGAGDYTFTGLAAGICKLGLSLPVGQSLTFPGAGFQSVTLQNDDTASGVDFGVLASPVEPTAQQVTSDSSVQQQPSIAVDPNDPMHVVMAYMDYGLMTNGYAGIGIKVSHDAGATWNTSSVSLPAAFDQAAGQPIVQFAGAGKVHVSFMAAKFLGQDSDGTALKPGIIDDTTTQTVSFLNKTVSRRAFGMQANNGVFVARSDDGGLTWNPPVAVSSQRYDQTATTSTAAVGTGAQTVTPAVNPAGLFVGKTLIIDEGLASMERVKVTGVTATTFTATFAKSHSAGFTISAPVVFDTQPDLAIDNSGTQYVTWTRFYPAGLFPGQPNSLAGSEVMIAVSQDGGQTWTTRFQMVSGTQFSAIKDPLTGTTGATGMEGTGNNQLPRVTVGPDGGVYVSQSAGNRFPIFYSSDAGATFRDPDPGNPSGVASGYPFGLDDDRYTAIYPAGASDDSFVPGPTLFNNSFRTQAVRDIVADPSWPGAIYAVESVQIINTSGVVLDRGEITFARSTDHGLTWTTVFTVGSDTGNLNELAANLQFRYRGVLNDDNDTRFIGFDGTLQDEVIAGQALPQMSVDADGNIAVIWYDTRRDPANGRLDVYGTVSTDGGLTFSANSRLTSANFDANLGAFTDARNAQNFYLGDRIGLALANGQAYAAWTDTRNGNQDIFVGHFGLVPAPVPLGDRFELNDTPITATDLGNITARRVAPRLSLGHSDHDWFRLKAGVTGNLIVSASAPSAGNALQLELWDATGATKLANGAVFTQNGQVAGQQLVFGATAGENYLVHITGSGVPSYSVTLQALTADLGTHVQGAVDGSISAGTQALYSLVTPVAGSVEVALTASAGATGRLNLQVLSADSGAVLASGDINPSSGEVGRLSLPVNADQRVLLQVSSVSTTSVLVNGVPATLALGTPGTGITFTTPANGAATLQVNGGNPLNVRVTYLNGAGAVVSTQDMLLQPGTPTTLSGLIANGGYRLQALAPAGSGTFHIDFTNFDQFQTSGSPPITTQAAAEDLGTVVHAVLPTHAIVTGFTDAWFKLTVPTKPPSGSGDQVLDFSAGFTFVQGAGLQMEILDANGSVIASGELVRVAAAQGATLYVHIFALPAAGGVARGAGLFNLAIDVVAPPAIAAAFSPSTIAANGTSTLTFTITNPNAGTSLTGVGFTNTLPVGLTVANGASSVGGGTLTITGGNTSTLTGATIAPGAQLVFSVIITGAVPGSYTNATGMVTSSDAGAGSTASATITVRPNLKVSQRIIPRAIYPARHYAYSITVFNHGSAAVSGVTIRDVLPTNAMLLGPLPLRSSLKGRALTINVGAIAGNGSKTFLVKMYVPITTATGASIKNRISVRAAVSGVVGLSSSVYSYIVAPGR